MLRRSCGWRMKRSNIWPRSPNANALHAICTICWDTRLSLITLKAELARKLVDRDPQRAKQEMQDVEQTSRAALADVRVAISGFRSDGLGAELVRARAALETAGITRGLRGFRGSTQSGAGNGARPGDS